MTAIPPPRPASSVGIHREDAGYRKSLRPRQLQMIAIGGAIGTGLFLGSADRLRHAGPGLFLVYAICGVFVFFVLRALGELVTHRPTSGSFVSYAREFYGEKLAFGVGLDVLLPLVHDRHRRHHRHRHLRALLASDRRSCRSG